MAYVTAATVKSRIAYASAGDYGGDLTDSQITNEVIPAAEAWVNDELSENYAVPFNATDSAKTDGTDTYTTPLRVAEATAWRAAFQAIMRLAAQARNTSAREYAEVALDQAQFEVNQIKGLSNWLPAETYRGYSLTFGSGTQAWELDETEAYLEPDVMDSGNFPFVHIETVRLSANSTASGAGITAAQLATMRYGIEYRVDFSVARNRFVFCARDRRIIDDMTTVKVNFRWSYRKVLPLHAGSGRVGLG